METERMYDYVVASEGCALKDTKAMLDYDSRPHKPVRFEMLCREEPQATRMLKAPRQLLGE